MTFTIKIVIFTINSIPLLLVPILISHNIFFPDSFSLVFPGSLNLTHNAQVRTVFTKPEHRYPPAETAALEVAN